MRALILVLFVVINGSNCEVSEYDYETKPPLFRLDNFDHCMIYGNSTLFCNAFIQLSPQNANNKSKTWNIIEELIREPSNYRHDILRHSICIPEVCPAIPKALYVLGNGSAELQHAIADCYTNMYKSAGLKSNVTYLYCEGDSSMYSVDRFDIVILFLFVLFITMTVFATLAQYKFKPLNKRGEFITCFAVQRHWEDLFAMGSSDLACIQGLKVFSMVLVICAHTYMAAVAVPMMNTRNNESTTKEWYSMALSNGALGLQSSFLIAGFLLSLGIFRSLEIVKKASVSLFAKILLYRYMRLAPVMLVCMLWHMTWFRHVGRGPFWEAAVASDFTHCRDTWWANLLYIHNYYDPKNMCIPHTWYLAVDTQLFVISLFVLYVAVKFRKYAMHILAISVGLGYVIPFVIHYVNEYDIILRVYPEASLNFLISEKEWHQLSIPAGANIGSYMQGLFFGYIYYKYKTRSIRMNKVMLVIWYIIVLTFPFLTVHSAYFFYNGYKYSKIEAALYHTLSRNIIATSIGLLILGVSSGYGGIFKKALEFPPFSILGRLCYSVYVFHCDHLRLMLGRTRLPSITHYDVLINRASGDILISFTVGLICYLLFEAPAISLTKLWLSHKPANAEEIKPLFAKEKKN